MMTKILIGLALLILAINCMLSASDAVNFVDFLHELLENLGLVVGLVVCFAVALYGFVMIALGIKSLAG